MRRFFYKIGYPAAMVFWFIFRPRTFGVRCIVVNRGRILLIKNSYNNRGWDLPGGGVHRGENLDQAAMREVFEETGIRLKGVRKIGEFENREEYKRDLVNVFVGATEQEEMATDYGEIETGQWFDLSNIPPLFVTAQKAVDLWDKKTEA
jgi:ADP-ribose pyrophosphatase YjhB (NUDIX family)